MRPALRLVLALALTQVAAPAAFAAGPLFFQHGGRATAEVGAFTGRADSPVAVAYNPAAVARLPHSQYQLGLDFTAPQQSYKSSTGAFEADHLITQAPGIYATWHLPDDYYPWAFGIGLDRASWYLVRWGPALFPGREITREQELSLWALHPVVAYELGDRWSVGLGARYYYGDLAFGNNQDITVPGQGQVLHTVEVERTAEAQVDGFSFDLGLHYAGERWSWGLVYDSGGEVSGSDRTKYEARDVPNDPVVQSSLDALLRSGSSHQSFDLPQELRTGIYIAPIDEIRLELDLAWMTWSDTSTPVSISPDPFSRTSSVTIDRRRDWDDTLSIRLGMEADLGEHFILLGGLGWEPTPVPSSTVEPGFPRGDALVYGLGFGYKVSGVQFELGYSFFDYDSQGASGQEPDRPNVNGSYQARDQVFAFSASWKR